MKTSRKNLIKKCDVAWSAAVKHLAGYECQVCKKTGQLNSHHVIGRVNYSLRWDLKNGVCLCVSHHRFSRYSAHENPIWFLEWYREHFPDNYKYLKDKKNELAKYLDYEQILKELKEVINDIQ